MSGCHEEISNVRDCQGDASFTYPGMLIFSFRARAGRLLLLDVSLLNMVLASHVLGMSVMCILKNPVFRGKPSILAVLASISRLS